MQIWKIGACSMLMALLAAVTTASATPPMATAKQRLDTAHAVNPSMNMHPAVHPGPAEVRAFAETALQHLKGPAQRPFLKLLNSLPPKGKEPGIAISTKATRNVSCSDGVCTPTAAKAVLNVSELIRLLVDGNVTIATSAAAPDIFVNAPFSWTSANMLTLQAIGNIVVNKAVSDAGPGPLDLEYDITGGSGGMLSFGNKGSIGFMGIANPLTINGQSYLLAADIRTMARLIQDNPSGNFALARSYDARHDGTYSQSPFNVSFAGNFEGLGNTISGLHIECVGCGGSSGGVVQQIDQGARWDDVRITHTKIKYFDPTTLGGMAGYNAGTMYGDSFSGDVSYSGTCRGQTGAANIGGLVGTNDGTVQNSQASGTVSAQGDNSLGLCNVGGLVGLNSLVASGQIVNSDATASVNAAATEAVELNVGGLAGASQSSGLIILSFATGSSIANSGNNNSYVGGLVGANLTPAVVDLSYATGPATVEDGGQAAGGLAGGNTGTIESTGLAQGAVSSTGDCLCGGAVGWTLSGSSVSDINSYGTVSAVSGLIGGFVGEDDTAGGMSNDGWCTTSSGITDPSQGAGNVPNDPGITPFTC